jgi:hypothetical protein
LPRIAFLDQEAAHILAVDQHARKRPAVTVRGIRARIPPDIDAARAEQLLQPVLGEDGQAELGLAFGMADLRCADALEPDALFIGTNGAPSITIRAAAIAARIHRGYPHNEYVKPVLVE